MSQTLFLLYRPEPARPMLKTRSVGAHSICARGSLPCRRRARADMESAPTFFVAGGPPRRGRCPAWSFLPLVESEIRRGAFYMRPRKFILPQAGTGGYGIRPYVFCGRQSPRAKGAMKRVFACCACKRIYFRFCLVKNHLMWYTISLQVHRQTRCKPATQSYRGPSGQPVANKKLLFYCRQ